MIDACNKAELELTTGLESDAVGGQFLADVVQTMTKGKAQVTGIHARIWECVSAKLPPISERDYPSESPVFAKLWASQKAQHSNGTYIRSASNIYAC